METRPLGNTDVRVSLIALGTMTWGEQNSATEAFEQLDYAVGEGVNFIDAAEMYPVPPKAETQGRTEAILGDWLQARGCRDSVVLATKVTGPGNGFPYLRGGPQLTAAHIREALEGSLRRLKTDYVDLYQIHWPSRSTNYFGKLGYQADPDEQATPLEETLAVLEALRREGKIRAVGLSNDTPWGAMRAVAIADAEGWARPVSIQNPYNLLNRSFELGLAEVAHREQMGLLAYSPLAFGVLSGKYLKGERPSGARLTLFTRFSRYTSALAQEATQAYADLAASVGLSPASLALAFVNSRPFLTSNIIGATTMAQLKENMASAQVQLTATTLDELEQIHRRYTYPCP